MATSRRLAAILAADVAGYSLLMGADEEGTLARVKTALAELVDPAVVAHHGRTFKTMGDGFLTEFSSVVEAVRCAVAVQRAVAARPESNIQFRIGIHVGDVIADGDDLYGDGVNIAARLEALAAPGGLCVSARVYEDVSGRIADEFDDGGEQRLKNIDRPVRIFRLRGAGTAAMADAEAASAQPAATPGLRKIGVLGVAARPINNEFIRALAAYGLVDGQTIDVAYRWCEGDYERLPALVRELLDLPVELIFAHTTQAVRAAKAATSTVPIVMVEVGDPVAYGIVPSLTRPGGNVTGMSNGLHEYAPRGLRLFKDIVPNAARVALLSPPRPTPGMRAWLRSMESVALALEMTPTAYYANTDDEIRGAFAAMDGRADVVVVVPEQGLLLRRRVIISEGLDRKIPVICPQPEYVFDGALLSIGPDRTQVYRRAAYYVDAILKGAKPSDLPVEEPNKNWLMLNLRTAKQFGIEIPGPILIRADELVE
jgi:putative ABC transport system substrate-binding protein